MPGLHEEIRNFEAFQNSTRRFTNFTKRIGGAMDIDCFIERNHCFMFLEGKPLIEDGNLIRMPYGQYMALFRLAKSSERNKVYIIGEDYNGEPKKMRNILYTIGEVRKYQDEQTKKWLVDVPTKFFIDITPEKLESFVYASYKMFEDGKYSMSAWLNHEAVVYMSD
jgi:hypothetical protein